MKKLFEINVLEEKKDKKGSYEKKIHNRKP